MRAFYVTLLLTALTAPGAQGQSQPTGAGAVNKDCSCGVTYRTRHGQYLHRPAIPKERTETSRLNREYLAAARAIPLPPPMPDRAQLAYQQQLKNYRALADSYERRMRDYRRLHPGEQAYLSPSDDARWQDAARLDPRPGGPGNGY
jgi:hypothetical protein